MEGILEAWQPAASRRGLATGVLDLQQGADFCCKAFSILVRCYYWNMGGDAPSMSAEEEELEGCFA